MYFARSAYLTWADNTQLHRLSLTESHHGLQVLTHLNEREVQRNWDLEYRPLALPLKYGLAGRYIAPIAGIRIKDTLSVVCKYKNEVCFNTDSYHWKIKNSQQELLPLIGVSAGARYKTSYLVIDTNLFLKTDLEKSFYGLEITLGGEQK